MGNLLSSKLVYNIFWSGPPNGEAADQTVRVSGSYTSDHPAEIFVYGRRILCTIEINGATICIRDNDHHVSILGNNITVNLSGSGTRVRLVGNNNRVISTGEQITVYSDDQPEIQGGATLLPLSDINGNPSEGLPNILQLQDMADIDQNRSKTIRYSYKMLPDDAAGTSDPAQDPASCKRPADGDNGDQSDPKRSKSDDP